MLMSIFLLGKGLYTNINSKFFALVNADMCKANDFVSLCQSASAQSASSNDAFDECISKAMDLCRVTVQNVRVSQILYISLYSALCLLKFYEFYLIYQGTLQTPDVIFKFKSKLLLAWIIDKIPNVVFALLPLAAMVPPDFVLVKVVCGIIGYNSALDVMISFLGLHTGFIRGSGECVDVLNELAERHLSPNARSSIRAFVGILQGSTFYMCCLVVLLVGAIGGLFVQTTSSFGYILSKMELDDYGAAGKVVDSWSRLLYSESTGYWFGISVFVMSYFALIALFKVRDVGKKDAEQLGTIVRFKFCGKEFAIPARKLAAYTSMLLGLTLFLIWTGLHGLVKKFLEFLLDSFLEYYSSRTFTTIVIADNLIACFVYLVPECESAVTGEPAVCRSLLSSPEMKNSEDSDLIN
jgi:hypothetical protein